MNKKHIGLCISLLVLNVLFIWGNSLLPRETSAAFSAWFSEILNYLFPGPDIPPSGEGHGILRKLAHFTEFCSLGFLLSWLIAMLRRKPWQHTLYPALTGAAVACADETIQLFVPGRGPGLVDVAIDTAGVVLGIVLWHILFRLRTKNGKNHARKNRHDSSKRIN